MAEIHKGQCFCGAVEVEVSGDPAGMGYCHCDSCRHWSAGPGQCFHSLGSERG
ncbi:GFA family protein [Tropicimonas aquimaris]